MKNISSSDNPVYKQLKRLSESARARRKSGETLLDGIHLVKASIESGHKPKQIAVAESALSRKEVSSLVDGVLDIPVVCLTDVLFSMISPVDTPTGVLALIDIPKLSMPEMTDFCLMVENVQDPGNLGSILRSAAASGVTQACLSSGCADAWSPKVLRGGMGAHFVLAIEEQVNLVEKLRSFSGVSLATSLDADISLFEVSLTGSLAVLVGNEGAGLSADLAAQASMKVRIPMQPQMESLNVAAATAICLFERVRQLGCVRG